MVLLMLATGCSSDTDRRGGPGGAARKPPTPMSGQEIFFNGQILAEIHVGTEGMPDAAPRDSGGPGGGEGRRRRGGGNGQMSMGGGSGGFGGNLSGNMPLGEGGRPSREFAGGPGGPGGGPRVMAGGGRPVLIHLRFTNQGNDPVVLRIADFLSPLGNFVVRPEQLTLQPGESRETEPMTSQLAGAFTETTVTLVLRLGDKSEKKSFPLKAVPAPAAQP
jgi:hypothetical protein